LLFSEAFSRCGVENDVVTTTTRCFSYVMSDWGATHSTSIMEGLDMEMPGGKFMNPTAVRAGISAGNISSKAVDDSVGRILYAMFDVGTYSTASNPGMVAAAAAAAAAAVDL
jgi:beta-glucosidase